VTAPAANPAQPQAPAAHGSVRPIGHQVAEETAAGEGRAQVTIVLPAGATLFVDDKPIPAGAGQTAFQTPPLKTGESYYYRMRAEVVRGGRPSREEIQVVVRAGEAVRVAFFDAPVTFPGMAHPSGR
jgi:uncharacterized protein (TIGR03000 family)